jgi:fluoroacetyl-CoA thioesterase
LRSGFRGARLLLRLPRETPRAAPAQGGCLGSHIVFIAMSEPVVDSTASARLTVTPSDLADTLNLEPGDSFPPVFATSRMVGLMEVAAARVLGPHLGDGEASVGVSVDVVHTAATPPGATVTATARFLRREGKLFLFEVSAVDNAGEIGRGTHKRAIVVVERLLGGAARRRAPA